MIQTGIIFFIISFRWCFAGLCFFGLSYRLFEKRGGSSFRNRFDGIAVADMGRSGFIGCIAVYGRAVEAQVVVLKCMAGCSPFAQMNRSEGCSAGFFYRGPVRSAYIPGMGGSAGRCAGNNG